MFGDPGKHSRPDLIAIAECEYVVGPTVALEGFVGSCRSFDRPSDLEQ
jgi:hypothetical protein